MSRTLRDGTLIPVAVFGQDSETGTFNKINVDQDGNINVTGITFETITVLFDIVNDEFDLEEWLDTNESILLKFEVFVILTHAANSIMGVIGLPNNFYTSGESLDKISELVLTDYIFDAGAIGRMVLTISIRDEFDGE